MRMGGLFRHVTSGSNYATNIVIKVAFYHLMNALRNTSQYAYFVMSKELVVFCLLVDIFKQGPWLGSNNLQG